MVARREALRAEYSASSVDKETSVCSYDFQMRGHGPKKMMKPVRDFAEVESSEGSILNKPAKSAST